MKKFNYVSIPPGTKTMTLPYLPRDKTIWVLESDNLRDLQIFGTLGWRIRRYQNRIVCTPRSLFWQKLGYVLRFKCGAVPGQIIGREP